MSQRTIITSPVGRIVMGSLYKGSTTDAEGKQLVVKTGPNAGQSRVNYFFALAIPKTPQDGGHWANTPWGAQIWAVGHAAFPQAAQSPVFAWKVEDGDSQVPNKKGRKPCENEGWAGHWIIKLSGGYAPKIYQQDGGAFSQNTQVDFVKPGHFVEVNFSVEGNGSQSQPGVYLNHSMICFRAYGAEIVFGPDVASAGFGQSALPVGATTTPPASTIPLPVAGVLPNVPAAAPIIPSAGATVVMPPIVTASVVPTVAVVPNHQFVQNVAPTAVTAPPIVPVIPTAAPAKQMTPLAQGATYEAMIGAGWTDVLLVQHGMMIA